MITIHCYSRTPLESIDVNWGVRSGVENTMVPPLMRSALFWGPWIKTLVFVGLSDCIKTYFKNRF